MLFLLNFYSFIFLTRSIFRAIAIDLLCCMVYYFACCLQLIIFITFWFCACSINVWFNNSNFNWKTRKISNVCVFIMPFVFISYVCQQTWQSPAALFSVFWCNKVFSSLFHFTFESFLLSMTADTLCYIYCSR